MAESITGLQLDPNLKVFRTCEIKRRTTSITYESAWLDVTDLVTQWPNVSYELDTISPFKYRTGQANLTFRNDEQQFGSKDFTTSKFNGYVSRYKTQVRISTGLEDEDGTQYPTTKSVFMGVFSDDITDTEVETIITVNDLSQVLIEFNASNIAASVTGIALTSAQIIGTIRDYTPSGASGALLSPFLSASAWFLTSTGRTYTIPTTTTLDGKSAFSLIEELALAENYVFFIDNSGNFIFKERAFSVTSDYTFKGPSENKVNVISLNSVSEGLYRLYNKFSCSLLTSSVVSTQESYSFGDSSNISLYGQREYSFANSFVDTNTAGSVCSSLLADHSVPKREVEIETVYITQLKLQNRVTLTYRGELAGDGSLWGSFLWGHNLWTGYRGGIKINEDFGIIGINVDMERFTTTFKLRGI